MVKLVRVNSSLLPELPRVKESLKAYYKKTRGKPEQHPRAKSAIKKRKATTTNVAKSGTSKVSSSRTKKGGNIVVKEEFKSPEDHHERFLAR
jgi:hypothetical protein